MQPPNLNEISEKRTVFWYSKTGTSLCTSQPWQGCTLPTELRPRLTEIISSPPLLRNPFPQPLRLNFYPLTHATRTGFVNSHTLPSRFLQSPLDGTSRNFRPVAVLTDMTQQKIP